MKMEQSLLLKYIHPRPLTHHSNTAEACVTLNKKG
jgi:hypothetical protein